MKFIDFRVRYDPTKDTAEDVSRRIIYTLFIKRMKYKKPVVVFMCGDSGEGKSISALGLEYEILKMQGMRLEDYMNDVNVYMPIEYPRKIRALLNDDRLKNVNVITVHEARELIRAKNWQDFLTQAVADINATSRAIKRLAFFIVSQFIRDITTDIRYTINFYIKCWRPMDGKGRPRLYIYVMWKDDHDLEKPKLRKRRLTGYLVYPSGKCRKYTPKYLEIGLPPVEIVKAFDDSDVQAKKKIIEMKMDKLVKRMEEELGKKDVKVDSMLEYYMQNPDSISTIGKRLRGKFTLKPEIASMHDLTPSEVRDFQKRLMDKIKESSAQIFKKMEEELITNVGGELDGEPDEPKL